MPTIYDILSSKFRRMQKKDGLFGLEIETEVPDSSDYKTGFLKKINDEDDPVGFYWETPSMPYWKGVYDGSLRNFGVEYILKEPLSFEDTMVALTQFGQETREVPFIKGAPGTSVHVHINFLNEEPVVLANFITITTLVENILAEISGDTRRSNLFAWPHRVAEGTMKNVLSLFNSLDAGTYDGLVFNDQHVKYSLMNIAPLARIGSIEIRSFRGTTDISEIQEWISILHKIYLYSKIKGLNPRTFYQEYQKREFEIVSDVFGELTDRVKVPGWEDMIQRNEYYFAKYATSVKDWYSFGVKYRLPKAKAEKKGTIDIEEYIPFPTTPGDTSWIHPASHALNALAGAQAAVAILDEYGLDTDSSPDLDSTEGPF